MYGNPSASHQMRFPGFGRGRRSVRSKWPLQATAYVPQDSPQMEVDFKDGGVRSLFDAVMYWFIFGRDGGGARDLLVSIEPKLARKLWGKNWKKWPFVLKRPTKKWIREKVAERGRIGVGIPPTYEGLLDTYESGAQGYNWFGPDHLPEWRSLLAIPMGGRTLEEMYDETGSDFESYPHFFEDGRGRNQWKKYHRGRVVNPEAWERWDKDRERLTQGLVEHITKMISRMIGLPPSLRESAYQLLGDGTFASVFMILKNQYPARTNFGPYLNNGKVLKITSDPIDLISCAKIAKKKLPNVVYIEKVGWLPGIRFQQGFLGTEYASYMGFMIAQQLIPVSKAPQWQHLGNGEEVVINNLLNSYLWFFEASSLGTKAAAFGILAEIDNTSFDVNNILDGDAGSSIFYRGMEWLRTDLEEAVKMAQDIASGIRQLIPYKIYPTDLHYGNVGYDPVSDTYKLIDIGLSKDTLGGLPLPSAIRQTTSEERGLKMYENPSLLKREMK